MPLYQGIGVRNYVIMQYKLNRNWDFWFRVAAFNYREIDAISAGINEIDGNTKTDITIQTKYNF